MAEVQIEEALRGADPEQLIVGWNNPHELAGRYFERHARDEWGRLTHRFWRGEWWKYEGGRYMPLSGDTVQRQLTKHLNQYFRAKQARDGNNRLLTVSRSLLGNTLNALMSEAGVPDESDEPCWINREGPTCISMQNGLVSVGSLLAGTPELLPHTPSYFCRVQLPYALHLLAACPRWLTFVREVMEGDDERIAVLQEWFGLCLVYDGRFQKFMFFEGDGENGKGVTADLLTAVIGADNVSNVPLERFRERFALFGTLGKLLNICNEVHGIDKRIEGMLKSYTGQDRLEFERKYRDPIFAVPTARILMVGNERPQFTDRSRGIWRRMILMPFRANFPAGQSDLDLREKLMAERPGIFLWAVEGLRRLKKQGGFTRSKVCEEALSEYRAESNPEAEFLDDHCEVDPNGYVQTQALYGFYVPWAKQRGIKEMSEGEFGKQVVRTFKGQVQKARPSIDGVRTWVYRGIAFREHVQVV